MFSRSTFQLLAVVLSFREAFGQTYTTCNPLTSTSCPADTALGKSINVDFTKGSVDSFTSSGDGISYDSSGAKFTVAKSGDAPTLSSIFYIMFGKVSITLKSAPGAGIVSTLVLQSDDLDEIDMEWLGTDTTEVQTNYFGKGDVTTYNRGQFNPAKNNQDQFITYTIEWTSSQITWSVGSTIVRVLTPATADANQYPQTPMRVKFGAWAGGDSSNPAGTISWARGPTDYTKGPFTMTVQSVAVIDYSTGTSYKYGDTSGSWDSIVAVGGTINGNADGAASAVASADVPAETSASPSIPAGIGGGKQTTDTRTLTGWPWVATATPSGTTETYSTAAGVPSGWVISSSGKIVPASSAASPLPTSSSPSPWQSQSSQPWPASGLEITTTGWDDRGFPTTRTLYTNADSDGATKSYNNQGFLVTSTAGTATWAGAPSRINGGAGGASSGTGDFSVVGVAGKIVGTSTSKDAARETAASWLGAMAVGAIVIVAEGLL